MIHERLEIVRKFSFEAAHRLPMVPAGHQCGRVHGHSYKIAVGVRAALNSQLGWVVDLGAVGEACESIVRRRLEHSYLNEVEGLQNPTAELICIWILKRLRAAPFPVAWVEVQETDRSSARAYAEGEQPWLIA